MKRQNRNWLFFAREDLKAAKAIEIARKIYRFCFSEVGEKSIGGVWRKKQ